MSLFWDFNGEVVESSVVFVPECLENPSLLSQVRDLLNSLLSDALECGISFAELLLSGEMEPLFQRRQSILLEHKIPVGGVSRLGQSVDATVDLLEPLSCLNVGFFLLLDLAIQLMLQMDDELNQMIQHYREELAGLVGSCEDLRDIFLVSNPEIDGNWKLQDINLDARSIPASHSEPVILLVVLPN